ncbi:hypothetical protein VU11_06230, partial [Desulfobulbus sp. US2]|nr:hypothetical protein [Desulfobulbus sp. US2]
MIGVDERVTTEEEIAESLHKEYVHEKVREEIYEGDNAEKDAEAKQRILYYTYAGMAMGFVPFPLLDLAALAALQLRML